MNSVKKLVSGGVSKEEKFMGAGKLALVAAAKTAKGAMVKYAVPGAATVVSTVKQTVKVATDYAKFKKGEVLKQFDAGKNKLKTVGRAASGGLYSFAGSLSNLNDNYVGGKLNKANKAVITPKIERFAVNPFTKLVGPNIWSTASLGRKVCSKICGSCYGEGCS